MKLENKKDLAARALKVGKGRLVFNTARLDEIKEAITKEDMRGLKESGVIFVKEPSGRKKLVKRKTRRRLGSKKIIVNSRKREYMTITRKLRTVVAAGKRLGTIDAVACAQLRKEIRARSIKSLAQMRERIKEVVK